MKPPRGKRRTRQHVIADLSIYFVEWQALRCGFTVERIHHDYGIDLALMTCTSDGEREPGDIPIQVKATDGLDSIAGATAIPCRIERAHLKWWLYESEPVILIVFDARKTVAFWICVQDYFAKLRDFNLFAAGETITVRIPLANKVNLKAIRGFARLRDEYRKNYGRSKYDQGYH